MEPNDVAARSPARAGRYEDRSATWSRQPPACRTTQSRRGAAACGQPNINSETERSRCPRQRRERYTCVGWVEHAEDAGARLLAFRVQAATIYEAAMHLDDTLRRWPPALPISEKNRRTNSPAFFV